MNATTGDMVAAARSMLSWDYRWAAHGSIGADGKPQTDCQYLVDHSCLAVGIADKLGPVLPWTVAYMVDHTSLAKVVPSATVRPFAGDIVCFTDASGAWAHTGVATSALTCVSALNPAQGVRETRIADISLTFALILRTGLPAGPASQTGGDMQPVTFDAAHAIGTLTLNIGVNMARLDTGATVGPFAAGSNFPVLAVVHGAAGGNADAWLLDVSGYPVPLTVGQTWEGAQIGAFTPIASQARSYVVTDDTGAIVAKF